MKKLLCLIISVVMLCPTSAFAEVITAEFEYDSVLNGFVVSGTSSDTKDFDEITVEAYYNTTPFDVVITETKNNGVSNAFETDMIYLDHTLNSGEIYFKVYSAHQSPITTAKFTYSGIAEIYPILKDMDSKLKSNNVEGFLAIASQNKDKLLIDYNSVSSFSPLALQTAKDYLKNINYTLPSKCETPEEKKETFECLSYLRKEFKNSIVIGKMIECDNTSELSLWYSQNKEMLNLKDFDVKRYKYFEDNISNQKMLSFLKSASTAFANFDKFKERIIGLGGLCAIESGSSANVSNVFSDFSEQITKLYNLTPDQEPSIFLQIAGTENATFAILSNLYNQLAYSYLYPPQEGNLPSAQPGLGNGPSKDRIEIEPITEPVIKENVLKNDEIFTDIGSVKWAKEAIYTLYNKGIVSGKTATTFDPNGYVTRAEFIKMLVAVKGTTPDSSKNIFSDINSSDWFAGYVNTAYKLNITKGYGDGTFRPYDKITREDMAVMIHRLLGFSNENIDLSQFTDREMISEYAKSAVSSLSEARIINGMGDGTFSPASFATRAQAAQMIYNFLK